MLRSGKDQNNERSESNSTFMVQFSLELFSGVTSTCS